MSARATMEWTCSTCEQQATAADWGLLATIGWRATADGAVRCSICAKAPLARMPLLLAQVPSPALPALRIRRTVES